MPFLKMLRSWLSPGSLEVTPQGVADAVRHTVQYCSLCSGDLAGHSLTTFASAIASGPSTDRTAELDAAIEARKWSHASTILEFDGLLDELVFNVLRCPHSPNVALLRVQSFTSFDYTDHVDRRIALSEADTSSVLALTKGPWIEL